MLSIQNTINKMRVLSAALTEMTDQNQSSQLETTNSVPTLGLASDQKQFEFLCAQSQAYLIVLRFLESEKAAEKVAM